MKMKIVSTLIAFALMFAFAAPASAGPLTLSGCPGGITQAPAATPPITYNPANINSGIPTTATCSSVFQLNNGDIVTLSGAITQRFNNTAPTNDGSATYYTPTGADINNPLLMPWNFDFYGSSVGTGSYWFEVLYDLDPLPGTDEANLGRIQWTGNYQDSQNLCFGFLTTGVPGVVTPPPAPGACTPNNQYHYSFAIRFGSLASTARIELGRVEFAATNMAPVPEPGSMVLLGTGLLGLAVAARKRMKARG